MKILTSIHQLDLNKYYTYTDYLCWQFRERVELILGKIFTMSPAPNSWHQHAVSGLHGNLFQFLKGRPCKVFPAPFDVVLLTAEGIPNTVVQPDVTVVCDPTKITEHGCYGTPDLIVEVISKSSVYKDLHEKYNIYEQSGVKEYWIVHPQDRTLIIFSLQEGRYNPSKPLTRGDIATCQVLQGFEIALDDLFTDLVAEPEEGYAGLTRV